VKRFKKRSARWRDATLRVRSFFGHVSTGGIDLHKALTLVAALLATAAPLLGAASVRPTIAVLPLAAGDTGIPYAVLPSRSELNDMTDELRSGLGAGRVPLVVQKRLAAAVSSDGFDQTVPSRSCVVAECARKIGSQVHADAVIVGTVTRAMAVIWGTELSIVDVHTGKVIGELNVGYKGDSQAMALGERYAGTCIARIVRHQKPCPPDHGW
jgi:hypothetical protein